MLLLYITTNPNKRIPRLHSASRLSVFFIQTHLDMEAKPDPPESEATAPVPVTVTEAVTVTAAPIAPEIIEIDDDEDDNDLVSADAKVSGASANPVQAVEKGTQGQKVNSTSLAVPPRPMPVNRFQKSDFELPCKFSPTQSFIYT